MSADPDATSFFEPLYQAASRGERDVPWDRGRAHPYVEEWLGGRDGTGLRAMVVGAGLGGDAELAASLGFDVVAFDVSPTAVEMVRERHPESAVDYRVANLLEPPAEWRHGFDLVIEALTVQSMPIRFHAEATANIAEMVAPGGTLLVAATGREDDGELDGPPYPLTRAEVVAFATGLEAVRIEEVREPGQPMRWRAEFTRRRPPASRT